MTHLEIIFLKNYTRFLLEGRGFLGCHFPLRWMTFTLSKSEDADSGSEKKSLPGPTWGRQVDLTDCKGITSIFNVD